MAILKREIIEQSAEEKKLIDDGKLSNKKSNDYVNNKELYNEFVKYGKLCAEAAEKGLPRPKMSDVIGRAIIQICTRRCNSRRFVGYSNNWKEEMIDHAIMTCACKAHKFDVSIDTQNPFAYITSIANNAIFEKIKDERKDTYIKYKVFDHQHGIAGEFDDNVNLDDIGHFNETDDVYDDRLRYISQYEKQAKEKRESNSKPKDVEKVVTVMDKLAEMFE